MITEIRASKLARPMTCAGSLYDLPPETEAGEPAKQGTAAGEWLERILTKKDFPAYARNGVAFDSDMKFYTQEIAERIIKDAATEVLCEERIDWMTRSGIKVRGSFDVSYVDHKGELWIRDLKYGWGIVEAKENWQLLAYAIGDVIRRGVAFSFVNMCIEQPRPHHEDGPTRVWRVSYSELLAYKEKIEVRLQEIADGDRNLVSGKQCQYCEKAVTCPAFSKSYHRGVDVIHEYLVDNLTEAEIAFQLDLLTRVEEIVKIRRSSLDALAASRVKDGKIIPGYTTENSYGHAAWNNGITAEVVKMMTGRDITVTEMISPAQARKILPKELVNTMTYRPFKGVKTVKKDTGVIADKVFGAPQLVKGEV